MERQGGFRQDINGLRAWAVIAVVLYHFGVPGFNGGFSGVDIFFVISGYLMTAVVLKGAIDGKADLGLSLFNFYTARAKRIIPALVVLCACTLLLGSVLLSPSELVTNSKDSISSLFFLSNVKYWLSAGYFDSASHEKLFLHTWSLSVEWQFYLLFPILVTFVWALFRKRKSVFVSVFILFVVSLIASLWMSSRYPTASFYLLPTRCWELAAGGLVFFLSAYSPGRVTSVSRYLELVGLLLMAFSFFFFDSKDVWPGHLALVPVLGACLVILAARTGSIATDNFIFQWIGNCSYSLYLWHWPIVVTVAYLELSDSPVAVTLAVLLSFACAYLSYRFVESPTRSLLGQYKWPTSLAMIGAGVSVVLVLSLAIVIGKGLPQRMSPEVDAIFAGLDDKNPRMKQCHLSGGAKPPECIYGKGVLGAIVLGDSHAQSFVRSVEAAAHGKSVLDWTMASCQTIRGLKKVGDPSHACSEFLEYALEKQKSIPSDVPLLIVNRYGDIFSGPNEPELADRVSVPSKYISKPYSSRDPEMFAEMRDGIVATACEFAKYRPVYMLRPVPELGENVPLTMGRSLWLRGTAQRVSVSREEYMSRNRYAWEAQDLAVSNCGVRIIDPTPVLCTQGRCWGDIEGTPSYYDDDHLSESGAHALVPVLTKMF